MTQLVQQNPASPQSKKQFASQKLGGVIIKKISSETRVPDLSGGPQGPILGKRR